METQQEEVKNDSVQVHNPSPVRQARGKKRTQIIMSGYKGQKEEFANAVNQSITKDMLIHDQQSFCVAQQNEQSILNEMNDQESDLLHLKKDQNNLDKTSDSQNFNYNDNRVGSKSMTYTSNLKIQNSRMTNSSQVSIQKKLNPYQGQEIFKKLYFNYTQIYEGKDKQGGESTNFPLIMKLKDIALKWVNSLQSRRQKLLTELAYNLINDKSFINDTNKGIQKHENLINATKNTIVFYYNSIFGNSCASQKISNLLSCIPVFSPSNTYKFLWDLIQLFVIIFCIYFVPLTFVFKMRFKDVIPMMLGWLFPAFLLVDIFINMNTCYYDKGSLITQRNLIFIHYIKKYYVYDILSVVPLFIHFLNYERIGSVQDPSQQGYKLTDSLILFILLKASHMSNIIRRIEERFHLTPRAMNMVSLIKLLFTILFVAHLFSQVWLFAAFVQTTYTSSSSWLVYYNLDQSPWYAQYIRAYYFVMVTMITVGYGDTLPTNDTEMILCIFTMLIACGVFGYSLNSIGMILMDFNSREKEIKDNLFTINNYMDQKNVNQDLQYKIRQYLDFYWREMKNSNIEKEEKIISQLSDLLRDELLLEANKFILKESPIFSSNFTDFMIMRTVKLIHEYRCAPKEVICFEDQQDDCSIYFIQKGEVDIIIDSIESLESNGTSSSQSQNKAFQNKTKVLQSLKKGDHFGGVSFFTGQPRRYSICSKEFTTLLMIRRQDFIELLTKESPEDYEMFCAIKDSILNYNNYSQLNILCFACQSENHLMGECPLIHYIANKQFLIKKLQFSPPQDSLRTYLRKKSKFKTMLKLNFVQKRIAKFCDFDEKEGDRLLDQYEQEYGIQSMSSESSRQSSSDYEPSNNRMTKSMASERSDRISTTSISKRNSQKLQNAIYNEQKSQDEISDNSQNVLHVNDQNNNYIYSQKFHTNQFKNGGSSGKISQKNPSSENVLEESDYTKVKIGEHLLYGSDMNLQNTNTQLGKSFKNFEEKGNYSYQKSSSFHSKYQSKMNTLYQLSIGSSGSQNQFMNLGINDLSEQLLSDNKNSYKTKSIARNSTHSKSMQGSNKNDYDALNNEMRYIDDGTLIQNTNIQYQMISEKLGKQILDIQLNSHLGEDQKVQQINAINFILENLKSNNNTEPERVGSQLFKLDSRKQSLTSSSMKYNAKKVESLFNYLFTEKKDNQQEKSQQQVKDQHVKYQEDFQQKQQRRNTKKDFQDNLMPNDQKAKKSQIDLEFESKKSFYQYFPHNNCERVILIANMSQIEQRKKLNKIVINKKMNKVERKQNKKNTRMGGNQSKFNKLLNSFQNQTEQDEEDAKDCVSTKRKQSNQYKRKISQFAYQQNDTKLEKSQESYISNNNDNNQNCLNNQQAQCSDLNCDQVESKQYSLQINNQEGQLEYNNDEKSKQRSDLQNDCDIELSPYSEEYKKENSKKFEFVLDEQQERKKYETKEQSNLLQFQRTMGKKKLSEIPENECPSSYVETNSQLMLNSKHLIHNSIQRGFTDISQEQQLACNSGLQTRQESTNAIFSNKRPSNFLNQEILNIQQHLGHQSHESIDKVSSVKTLQKHSLSNIDQARKSLLFDNNDQWIIGHSKDDCINPIFNMNIDLNEVKKYHKWDQNDYKVKYK
ncbi:hypothetical protein ABPG74_021264 [Tetrahymena malaccensis]